MDSNRKKVSTIVDELTTFFFSVGSNDMVVKIKQKDDGYHVFIASNFDLSMQHIVEHLEQNLTRGRAPEIEESYWGLTGSGDFLDENELLLVGAMIDSAQVEICEGYATLNLFRAV